MRTIVATSLLVLASIFSYAQLDYVKRFETELKDDYISEEIYDFGEKGVILLALSKDQNRGEREWKVDHYDTDFNLINTHTFNVDKRYYRSHSSKKDNQINILLRQKRKGKIGILSIDLSSGSVEMDITEVKVPKKLGIYEMYSNGNITFLRGQVLKFFNYEYVNIKVDHNKASADIEPVQIPGVKSRHLRTESISVDDLSNNVLFHVTEKDRSTKRMISHFIVYNENGEKLDRFELPDESGKSIKDLSSTQLSKTERIITGTFSEEWKESSTGMYIGKMNKHDIEYINFYPFVELENFLNYLPERKQKRLEKRKKRKKRKGKDFDLNYQIASHSVIEVNDGKEGFIYIGEAYFPTYRSEMYTTTDANGNVTTHTRSVFDGYQYTHAVIARFDEEGNKLWDHIVDLHISRKPFYVKRFISIAEDKQVGIKATYSSDFRIYVKKFSFDGEITLDQESEQIDFGDGNKVKRAAADISYWYDNYFIVHGTQKIKEDGLFNNRKVFFMSKIKVD